MKTGSSTYLLPLFLMCAIFLASGAQKLAAPDIGFNLSKDKIAHFLVFGLLATLILRTPKGQRMDAAGAALAALLTSAYGAFDEFRQSFTPGRSVEFDDWIADSAGAIIAVILYRKWQYYRNLLEWRPKKRPIAQTANKPVEN